jgi:hypothetical protein
VIRFLIFLVGFGLLLVGAASNYPKIPLPFDLKSIVLSPFGATTFTLDVVLMVVGVFLVIIAGVFHRLNPLGD